MGQNVPQNRYSRTVEKDLNYSTLNTLLFFQVSLKSGRPCSDHIEKFGKCSLCGEQGRVRNKYRNKNKKPVVFLCLSTGLYL